MYYLLDNNKIYDSNNKRDVSSLEFDFQITIENNQLYKYYESRNWNCDVICSQPGFRCIGCEDAKKKKFIPKKQSENIYDLIEVGDLVKRDGIILEVTEIQTFDDETEKEFIFDSFLNSCCESDIQAIYKPNKKGDYIKVWEKI